MKHRKCLIGTAAIGATVIVVGVFLFLRTGESPADLERDFSNFVSFHGKNYPTEEEYEQRKKLYE